MTAGYPMTPEAPTNTSPAADVDRVLAKMGGAAFGYRNFPRPVEDLAAPAPDVVDRLAIEPALPAVVRTAPETEPQPAASRAEVGPVAGSANPFLPRVAAPSVLGVRTTPLDAMFRSLSGPTPVGGCLAPACPFRRR